MPNYYRIKSGGKKKFSKEIKEMISRTLEVDPQKRWTAKEILRETITKLKEY